MECLVLCSKAAEKDAAQAARIAALEASLRSAPERPAVAPLTTVPSFPVLGGDKRAPKGKVLCWGCSHSTMKETKAVKFRPMMNLDLLPFDDGIGCGQYHNHATCNCGGAKSHQCPLLSCGLFYSFKKFHPGLGWRGVSEEAAPYSALDPAKPPADGNPPPGAAGGAAKGGGGGKMAPCHLGTPGTWHPAKGKGGGKGKGKKK